MRTTITIRADAELRDALRRRAAEAGLTLSAYLRRVLEREVEQVPLGDRAGHLRGRLRLSASDGDAWRERIRGRNWRT